MRLPRKRIWEILPGVRSFLNWKWTNVSSCLSQNRRPPSCVFPPLDRPARGGAQLSAAEDHHAMREGRSGKVGRIPWPECPSNMCQRAMQYGQQICCRRGRLRENTGALSGMYRSPRTRTRRPAMICENCGERGASADF